MPRTSSSRRMRCSSPSILISDPEYLPNRIRSPAFTSRGMTLPSSLIFPLPTATTLPSWGFSFAVSGMMMPPVLFCSCSSSRLTISRSASGRIRVAMTPNLPPGKRSGSRAHRKSCLWNGGAARGGPGRSRAARAHKIVRPRRQGGAHRLFCWRGERASADAGDEAVLDPAGDEGGGLCGRLGRVDIGRRLADLAEGSPLTQVGQGDPLHGVHCAVVDPTVLAPDPEHRRGAIGPRPVPDAMERPVGHDDLERRDRAQAGLRPFG